MQRPWGVFLGASKRGVGGGPSGQRGAGRAQVGLCSSPRGSQSHQGTFHRSWGRGSHRGCQPPPPHPRGWYMTACRGQEHAVSTWAGAGRMRADGGPRHKRENPGFAEGSGVRMPRMLRTPSPSPLGALCPGPLPLSAIPAVF